MLVGMCQNTVIYRGPLLLWESFRDHVCWCAALWYL